MTKKKSYRRYSPEFKREAIKRACEEGVPVYFCDPRSPWQRGTNENTNRLLRQYFPKKTPLGHYSQNELNSVSEELNHRPRKVLAFNTPESHILEDVALTG